MWWRSVLLAALALSLAACQVRPLYLDAAPGAARSGSPAVELSQIVIDTPTDRPSQLVRNELAFLFRGRGGDPSAPTYRLRTIISVATDSLAVELEEDLPAAILLQMNATFILSELATERTLLTGSSLGTASYDFSSQRFANVRAEKDALERAARAVAENIAVRISAYFAAKRGA